MPGTSYLFVNDLTWCDEDEAQAVWQPIGAELGPADGHNRPRHVPGTLVLEALAQCAGLFLRRTDEPPETSHWMLTGVDNADVDVVSWDFPLTLTCTIQKRGASAAVLNVNAASHLGEVCHATILMHRV